MKIQKKYIFSILFGVVFIFVGFFLFRGLPQNSLNISNNENQKLDSEKQSLLEQKYQEEIFEILETFFEDDRNIEGIYLKLQNVTVPYTYRDIHLDLVVAFSYIEDGRTKSDQALIEQGFEKIDSLANEYPWLKK